MLINYACLPSSCERIKNKTQHTNTKATEYQTSGQQIRAKTPHLNSFCCITIRLQSNYTINEPIAFVNECAPIWKTNLNECAKFVDLRLNFVWRFTIRCFVVGFSQFSLPDEIWPKFITYKTDFKSIFELLCKWPLTAIVVLDAKGSHKRFWMNYESGKGEIKMN